MPAEGQFRNPVMGDFKCSPLQTQSLEKPRLSDGIAGCMALQDVLRWQLISLKALVKTTNNE